MAIKQITSIFRMIIVLSVLNLLVGCNSSGGSSGGDANGGAGGEDTITYSVSGTVTVNDRALPGVTVTLSGAGSGTATTDAGGSYAFAGLAKGTYTFTPELEDYTFTPLSRTETLDNEDISGVDFTGVLHKLWISDTSGKLGTVNILTGEATVIGDMKKIMTDIAFDPDGNLYGITFNELYAIDTNTAEVTLIGDLGIISANSLVIDDSAKVYTATDLLYTVNVATGSATLIGGDGGDPYSSSGDLAVVDGELYLTSSGTKNDNLVKLDMSTGEGDFIGDIGFPHVYGLASDNYGNLYGVTGTTILGIDPATGTGTALVDYKDQGLGIAWGTTFKN